jgi:aminoglycoside phosphotransferase (APT) family kinase protein
MPPDPADLGALRTALTDTARMRPGGSLRPLRGGVSSAVAVVEDGRPAWVAKMPRGRMAVAEEWYVDRSRGGREADALTVLAGRIGPLRVPRLAFVDRDRMVLGMELITAPARPWKEELLAGRVDLGVAAAIGAGMAALHRVPAPRALAGPDGRALFDALRTGPYYRTTAARVPALGPALHRLIDDSGRACRGGLVHGDLNPKNVLVTSGPPVLLDWEIVHAGDPAFDLGMVVAHLLLKACRSTEAKAGAGAGTSATGAGARAALTEAAGARSALTEAAGAVWRAYDGPADQELAVRHAGAIMAARVHGKSPVDYLRTSEAVDRAMAIAGRALGDPPPAIEELLQPSGVRSP